MTLRSLFFVEFYDPFYVVSQKISLNTNILLFKGTRDLIFLTFGPSNHTRDLQSI